MGDFKLIGNDKWIPRFCNEVNTYTFDAYRDYTHEKYYLMVWNKLIKRELIEKNYISFPIGIHHGEDTAWSFSLACAANNVAYVTDITYNHYVNTDGLHAKDSIMNYYTSYLFLIRYYYHEAMKYGKADDTEFRWWFEKQKALHFGQTQKSGTKEQLHQIYSIIRQNLPMKGWDKMRIHYQLPAWLGILAYKKWHGMWMINV